MTLNIDKSERVMVTVLQIDAMHYKNAVNAVAQARQYQKQLDKPEKWLHELRERWDAAELEDDEVARYDIREPIAIQLESAEYDLASAYGPILQQVAICHISCAACLEAHINTRAYHALSGKAFEHFEKLSLEGKWLFLPAILGKSMFDPGSEPFQGFAKLIRFRNSIAHYKHRWEEWKPLVMPEFLKSLGLTIEAAEGSLKATAGMLRALATDNGDEPSWLAAETENFFDVDFVDRP